MAFSADREDPESRARHDVAAIDALGSVLAGSGRPLVVTSGTLVMPSGRISAETDAPDPDSVAAHRLPGERAALAFAERGVRVSIVRPAPTVHGPGDYGFVPALVEGARKTGDLTRALLGWEPTYETLLDDPRYDDLFAAAAALGQPIFIHPRIPSRPIRDAAYSGFDPMTELALSTFGRGWHLEAELAALRLIVRGTFDRHPDLHHHDGPTAVLHRLPVPATHDDGDPRRPSRVPE